MLTIPTAEISNDIRSMEVPPDRLSTKPLTLQSANPASVAQAFLDSRRDLGMRTLVHHNGDFFNWVGSHYEAVSDCAIRSSLYNFLEKCTVVEPAGATKPFRVNSHSVTQIKDALQAKTYFPSDHIPIWIGGEKSAPARSLVSCANGILDLTTKSLSRHSPNYFCKSALPFAFDPKAESPHTWTAFLSNLFSHDASALRTLQELFGYLLSDDTSQQKLFLILGPPRSGKGTIGRVLTALLGQSNVVSPTLSSFSENFGLQALIGKKLATINDARLGSRVDQQIIAERLLSISGEDTQTIDRKYRGAWTGRLPTRILLLSNELPAISDPSGAFLSRFIVVQLRQSYLGREDPDLTKKLLGELPGVLNWAVEGWERLTARGHFEQPNSSVEALEDLEAASSPIRAFVRERCCLDSAASVPVAALFDHWRSWSRDAGRERPGNIQQFGRELKSAFPSVRSIQTREEGNRHRGYKGIRLRK